MKLKFIINKSYDSKMVHWMLENSFNKPRLLLEKLDLEWGAIKNLPKNQRKKKIQYLINKKYAILLPYLKKTVQLYQCSWDEINNEVFKTIKEITEHSWKYKIYFCVVSLFHRGISNWGGNKIIRGWEENPYIMRKITTHELIISHIFTIFEREFKEEKLTNKEKWAIAEICAWAITGLEKKMLKFWPWISEKEKFPLNHNYPHLYRFQKILRAKYEVKKNFKDFFEKSIKVIQGK